jgi:hypothetical protein
MPADLNLLNPKLAARSLSKEEIVLSFEDVLPAIHISIFAFLYSLKMSKSY